VKQLRWLAVIPFTLGVLFLFVALLWTEVVQFALAVTLFVVAAGVWRAFAGRWPPEVAAT
jgi:hypothetical protein